MIGVTEMIYGEKLFKKLLIVAKLLEKNEWNIHDLSWETGLDIDTIRKLLKELRKNYLLEVTRNDVVWNPSDNPSTIKPWGWRLVHKLVLGSTQISARGYGPWTIVVAEYLLTAYGRYRRTWKTQLGGLWITITLSLKPEHAVYVPIAVPIILVRVLDSLYKVEARIKWPNDIVVDGRKLAGILIEASAFPNQFLTYIGLGINVNNDPPVEDAISLKKLVGLTPRNRLLASIIGWMSKIKKIVEDPEELMENYLKYLDTLNKWVIVETPTGTLEGLAVDVESNGALVVVTSNGEKHVLEPSSVYRLRTKE